jgi:hypothetical protein
MFPLGWWGWYLPAVFGLIQRDVYGFDQQEVGPVPNRSVGNVPTVKLGIKITCDVGPVHTVGTAPIGWVYLQYISGGENCTHRGGAVRDCTDRGSGLYPQGLSGVYPPAVRIVTTGFVEYKNGGMRIVPAGDGD